MYCDTYPLYFPGICPLDSGSSALKKKLKSHAFGEVVLYQVSAKENQAYLDEYAVDGKKSPTYKKNVAQTDWLQVKGNSEAVSYEFNCYGLSDEQASKALEGLEVLPKK